ncbi:hypothetical protein EOM39_02985 [Candidatus Gracilibacteria bacterium]|nr:hypothetical protein [Candidatus Gracilibacteria bacterium]
MKKIIILVLIILSSFSISTFTYAETTKTSNAMFKLYKKAILTRSQIKKDYIDGEKINSKIEKYFINLYFKTDRVKRLKEIEKKMGDIIKKYEGKKLTIKQEKSLNIIKNIYYRAVIDLEK